ncbi:MAG: PKD domain-containing protein [Deltaproteobacteria bacterium]|nr:PKD domain-containing protein [Deltaproteobacteria bacterium]
MARKIALALLAAILLPASASATDVIGNLNVNTRWDLAGSPYVLTGDVTVAPQATLTIEPGVVVQGAASDALGGGTDAARVELIVRGTLVADGSAASPIRFQGASQGAGSWYGITLDTGAGASSITNAEISDAELGLWMRTSNRPVLSDLFFEFCGIGLLWQASPGPVLDRVTVKHATLSALRLEDDGSTGATAVLTDLVLWGSGDAGVEIHDRVNVTLRRSRIYLNDVGVRVLSGGGLDAFNNVVVANLSRGFWFDQTGAAVIRIINNTIDRNVPDFQNPLGTTSGIGILASSVTQTSQAIVRNNLITNHGEAGIYVTGATAPALDTNDVWNNGANYVNASAGTNSISVNPLYVAPVAPDPGSTWLFVADPVSLRTSANNYSNTWTFQKFGASQMRLIVTYFRSETNYDFLRILNGQGGQVQSFTGSPSMPATTTAVPGTLIQARYTTDGSGAASGAGFDISGYEWLPMGVTFNYRLNGSSPAIDVGNDLDAPLEDADGTVRPYDGDVNGTPTTDIGAYEWHQNIAPMAVAGPDLTILPGTAVSFDGRASNDPDGSIVSWAWDFGDGGSASTEQATHTFASLGTYTVTLTVTDDQAATGTDTATITVADNLAPVADAGVDLFAAVGEVVNFDGTGSSDPDGTIVGYAWDFGDGAPAGSGPTVSHTYGSNGVYTVTLTVTDDRGLTGTDTTAVVIGGGASNLPPTADAGASYAAELGSAITFDGSGSSDADGSIASYSWDLGDGNTATGVGPTHTYSAAGSYLVTLTVTDDDGATATDTTLATVSAPGNTPPTAGITAPGTAGIGESVVFDGSASADSDGTIVAYAWDFGDGATGTGAQASHAFTAAGAYLVRLTVTDDGGAIGQDVHVITVGGSSNQPPVADAGGTQRVDLGSPVLLDGSDSSDPDGTIVSYAWELGDGTTESGAAVTKTYATAGSYLVKLTVTDDQGATDEDFALIEVVAPEDNGPAADGCGCSAPGKGESGMALALMVLGLALVVRRR